jgi:cytosine/adenosine deaminase-related metal-dependent hydrolase
MATIQGAIDSHLDHKIGTLTPGKEADIIMLRTDAINITPMNNAPGAVVTLMDTSNVDTVLIAGKVMKRNGKLVDVDLRKIRRTVEASREAVLKRAGYRADLFGSCCVETSLR